VTEVRFHPEAQAEFDDAIDRYLAVGRIVALRFLDEVERATESIADAPRRWTRGTHGTHRLSLVKYPFTIVYRVRGDDVEIVAVAHQSRRPGYWSDR
jgi:plasmid stabilization system protein ParE